MLQQPINPQIFLSDQQIKSNLEIYYFYGREECDLIESTYTKLYSISNIYDFLSYYDNHWTGINMYPEYRQTAFLKYPERYKIPFSMFCNLVSNIFVNLRGIGNRQYLNTYSKIIICSNYNLKELYDGVNPQTIKLLSKNIHFIQC